MPLLGFFTNSSEETWFITEHNLDPAMLKKNSMFSDNRRGPKIEFRIYVVACHIGMVLFNCHGSAHQIYVWVPIRDIHKCIGAPIFLVLIRLPLAQFSVLETMRVDCVHTIVTQAISGLFSYQPTLC
jgi:hypothetical protein